MNAAVAASRPAFGGAFASVLETACAIALAACLALAPSAAWAQGRLGRPEALVAVEATSSSLTLAWQAAAGATSYSVYRALAEKGSYAAIGATKETKYRDEGLASASTYYYKIRSANASGPGPYSAVLGARTKPRTISFSGYEWEAKKSDLPLGPGENYWSDSPESVWTDGDGLHLRLRYAEGRWQCAEVSTLRSGFGYGTYVFRIRGRYDLFDADIVAGLFTYESLGKDRSPQEREIDVELSRWGDPSAPFDAQFAYQYRYAGAVESAVAPRRFASGLSGEGFGAYTTHSFAWSEGAIRFRSSFGHRELDAFGSALIAAYDYADPLRVPVEAGEKVHINLWIYGHREAGIGLGRREAELLVTSFEFVPESQGPVAQ